MERKAEGSGERRTRWAHLMIIDAPMHRDRCHTGALMADAAHFRAQALANVDGKLRESTYVIDPANNCESAGG